jgi:hypothetical protein
MTAARIVMNLDRILETFSAQRVDYILIGGVNFLLRHEPVTTYDIDRIRTLRKALGRGA